MSQVLRPVTPVGILADRLRTVHDSAVDADCPPDVVAGLAACHALAAGLEPYVEECTTPESPTLAAVALRTRQRDWSAPGDSNDLGLEAEMLSGHPEGRFLQFLVAMTGARRILEIGMFSGYSALAMAEALPAGGRLVACELDADVARFAQDGFELSPWGANIDVRVGPATDTLERLSRARERFDLVFIDADKAGYNGYLDAVLEGGLLAENGTVCVDNTLMQGQPWLAGERTANGEAISAFNRAVARDPRVQQVLLPLRDGITLIRRR